ncbi:GntR family transcriptional regulator [Alloalcanivorax marinus]|uniref:GntR family transcriptional regulator n=1 Tax=Alloalcanivorax marinus TaxID=1177169 RepID=UPI001931A6A2|nr:GntR family transcriptional regulator [Alloalcanivorax marinus]MBL7250411.1 GntR family transcriptional regulator [Alloalcanivorax marinus]
MKNAESRAKAVLEESQHNTEPAIRTVLAKLREKIVTGEVAPGTRLRADSLAEQFEVSRTPVRSALAILATEGLVTYNVNRGYTVHAGTIGNVLDSMDVRASLESRACRLCVDLGVDDEDLERLKQVVGQGRELVEAGAWSEQIEMEWYSYNVIFHRMLHRLTNNDVLRNAIRMTIVYPLLGDVVRICPAVAAHVPQSARRMSEVVPDHIEQSQREHESLIDAIAEGDAERAESIMFDHVMATKKRVHSVATLR